jgi:hypothetical protein
MRTRFHRPKGTPHTYRVESPHGARWLTVTVCEDFDPFAGRPSGADEARRESPTGMSVNQRFLREHVLLLERAFPALVRGSVLTTISKT